MSSQVIDISSIPDSNSQAKTRLLDARVPIDLDTKRQLCYDFNALALVEEKTGAGVTAMDSWQNLGMKTIRTIIWAGLVGDDPKLTEKKVGAMLHPSNMTYVVQQMTKAFHASMNFGKEVEAEAAAPSPLPMSQ